MVQASATNLSLVSMVTVSDEKQSKKSICVSLCYFKILAVVSLSSYLSVVTAPIFMCPSESDRLSKWTSRQGEASDCIYCSPGFEFTIPEL
jgi:hypothetical protein